MPRGKTNLKEQEETKSIPLKGAIPDRRVTIVANLSSKEEQELLEVLAENKDIFAYLASDLQGVSRDIIHHSLDIISNMKPRKRRQRKM